VNISSAKIAGNSATTSLIIPPVAIKPLSQIESPSSLLGDSNISGTSTVMHSIFIIKPATSLHLQPVFSDIAPPILKVLLGYFLCAFVILCFALKLYQLAIHATITRLTNLPTMQLFWGFRKKTVLICMGVFCIILGARLWMINNFGSALPYWDQWDAEAKLLYKPYFEGTLKISALFSPHNEHRIFFPRVQALALLLLNGQWDAKLQMEVNAVIYAVIGCVLFLLYVRAMRGSYQTVIAIFIALILSLPFGWENTLWGFQSPFYFLVGFSVAAIWLLEHHRPWTIKWNLGWFLGLCALFTQASGLLTSLAVIGVLLLKAVRVGNKGKDFLKSRWPTIVVCGCIFIAGLSLKTMVDGHRVLQAHSVSEFISALARCLAWPNFMVSWWSIFNWFPFAFMVVAYIWRFINDGRAARFTIGLGLLVVLQAGAIAFARAAGPDASRYMDILSFGLLVNFCSMLILWTEAIHISSRIKSMILVSTLWIWLPINVAGLSYISNDSLFRQILAMKNNQEAQRANVAAFLTTNCIEHLKDKPFWDIPYPDAEKLASILREPVVRQILPAQGLGLWTKFCSDSAP
jgi:hypothetical protein